jgi:hypothetical protein
MTVINGIEIDYITYKENEMKQAITNNDPIEPFLHVIIVVSNSGQFARRYILAKEFIDRMQREEPNVIVYVVELAYGNQPFILTEPYHKKSNPHQLQLRAETPLWHKENMINIGVRHLLPPTWKAFAWIDADIEFESPTWALDTLRILNGSRDIVQLFSHCLDMDLQEQTMRVFNSFAFQYTKKKQYTSEGINYWHPGYAWAMTRRAYERIGGLYELAILGSGDNIMSLSLIEAGLKGVQQDSSAEYKESVLEFQRKMRLLRLGYVPGVIRHHFHGSKKNRKYSERWQILVKHGYCPTGHICSDYTPYGLLTPTAACPAAMLEEIREYFLERKEDEGLI